MCGVGAYGSDTPTPTPTGVYCLSDCSEFPEYVWMYPTGTPIECANADTTPVPYANSIAVLRQSPNDCDIYFIDMDDEGYYGVTYLTCASGVWSFEIGLFGGDAEVFKGTPMPWPGTGPSGVYGVYGTPVCDSANMTFLISSTPPAATATPTPTPTPVVRAAPSFGVVTVANTSRRILNVAALNTANELILINDSDETMYLAFGMAAELNKGIRLNANGGMIRYTRGLEFFPAEVLQAICASGSKKLLVVLR